MEEAKLIQHPRAFSRNEQSSKHMHTQTHTPALDSVWLFYLPVNLLYLESPQALQTLPFAAHVSISPHSSPLLPLWPKSGSSFVLTSWLSFMASVTPRPYDEFLKNCRVREQLLENV